MPSISTMKKICLPGFTAPTQVIISYITVINIYLKSLSQHFSFGGIPFYVNSVKDIICKCIGTPCIASALARYPTVQDDVTYVNCLLLYNAFTHKSYIGKCFMEEDG